MKNLFFTFIMMVLVTPASAQLFRPQTGDQIMINIHQEMVDTMAESMATSVADMPLVYTADMNIAGDIDMGYGDKMSMDLGLQQAIDMRDSQDLTMKYDIQGAINTPDGGGSGSIKTRLVDNVFYFQLENISIDGMSKSDFPQDILKQWYAIDLMGEDVQEMLPPGMEIQDIMQSFNGAEMLDQYQGMVLEALTHTYIWKPIGPYNTTPDGYYTFDVESDEERIKAGIIAVIDAYETLMTQSMTISDPMMMDDIGYMFDEMREDVQSEDDWPTVKGTVKLNSRDYRDMQFNGAIYETDYDGEMNAVANLDIVNSEQNLNIRISNPEGPESFAMNLTHNSMTFHADDELMAEAEWTPKTVSVTGYGRDGYWDDENMEWVEGELEAQFTMNMMKARVGNHWTGTINMPSEDVIIHVNQFHYDTYSMNMDMRVEVEGQTMGNLRIDSTVKPLDRLPLEAPVDADSLDEFVAIIEAFDPAPSDPYAGAYQNDMYGDDLYTGELSAEDEEELIRLLMEIESMDDMDMVEGQTVEPVRDTYSPTDFPL